jgi:hypothetical protein
MTLDEFYLFNIKKMFKILIVMLKFRKINNLNNIFLSFVNYKKLITMKIFRISNFLEHYNYHTQNFI